MRLLYFASVRQRLERSEEHYRLPESIATVGELVAHLAGRDGAYAAVFADPKALRAAVNQVHVRFDAPLQDSDEVAFFPPVTGG